MSSLPRTRYVVAINCCTGLSDACINDMLLRQQIECLDVVRYDSLADLPEREYYELVQEHIPHLFILHGEDMGRLPYFLN